MAESVIRRAFRPGGSILAGVLVMLAALLLAAAPAYATYSSMVVDAGTGEVLNEVNPDAVTGPASLTKMMTLYLTFQALHAGTLKLNQPLIVSTFAASREPSRINIDAGDQVAVRDLILGLVTRSANNAATVLAEGIAGSEPEFARQMTEKARQLGMTSTVFRNAHGLPNPDQVTTARDMVRLALALIRDYPEEYHYFATREFLFRGELIKTHNHLVLDYDGADGFKTGYTISSGYNMVTSAVRDGRRLIGVVLGGHSASARDRLMTRLLDDGFANRPTDPMLVAQAAGEHGRNSFVQRAARVVAALSPIGRAEAATLSPSRRAAPVAVPVGSAAATDTAGPKWSIQIGAYGQEAMAERMIREASSWPGLKGRPAMVLPPGKAETAKLYRARLAGFSEKQAQDACSVVKRKGHACTTISPSAAGGSLRLTAAR